MPRKSDPRSSTAAAAATRRNDVSQATFVLADDHEEGEENPIAIQQRMEPPFAHTIPAPASAHTPAPKPKSASARAPASAPIAMASTTPIEEMDTDRPSESAPPFDKKGGVDRDTVAIEVRLSYYIPDGVLPRVHAPLARRKRRRL